MSAVSSIPNPVAPPMSIPKSVFLNLVKEVVGNEVEKRGDENVFPNRVSSEAVAILQRTAEAYLTNVFTKTDSSENKILSVDNFKAAQTQHDIDEKLLFSNITEGEKTILDFDEENDTLFE